MWAEHYIASRPIKVVWAGWESDTLALQQAGWSLSALQDVACNGMRLAMRHAALSLRGITDTIDFHYLEQAHSYKALDKIVLRANVASTLHITLHESGPFLFKPIDAQPTFIAQERKSMDDLVHFMTPLTRTQEIIIPEASISELLDKILQMQEPAKNERFQQMVREETWETRPRQNMHAQIITLAT